MDRNQSAPTSPLHDAGRGSNNNNNNNNSSRSQHQQQQQQQRGSTFGNNRNFFNFTNTSTFYAAPQRPAPAGPNAFEKIWKNISNSTQDIFNSGFSKKMSKTCSSCGQSLSMANSKRRRCQCCSHNYCTECMGPSCCRRCAVFRSNIPVSGELLNTLKVRDLKWYLSTLNIPSDTCYEKRELVELILATYPQSRRSASQPREQPTYGQATSQSQQQPEPTRSASSTPTTSSASASAYSSNSSSPARNTTNTQGDGGGGGGNGGFFANLHETADASSVGSGSTAATTASNIANNARPTSYSSTGNLAATRATDLSGSHLNLSTFNLEDVQSADEVRGMSVRQLKLLLARNYVDFKGCVEREELVTKVTLLWHDKQASKVKEAESEATKSDEGICKICMEHAIDCVLLECGHMLTCTACGKTLSDCPVCRQFVSRVVHVFKS